MSSICGDTRLIQGLYEQYDARGSDSSKIFLRIVSSLSHLISEKPALLGMNTEMHGLGLPHDAPNGSGYFDIGMGMVSAAASAGVNTVSSIMGGNSGGLGASSMMRQRL